MQVDPRELSLPLPLARFLLVFLIICGVGKSKYALQLVRVANSALALVGSC